MKEKLKPCSWCTPKGELYLGPGKFRDIDSDVSYGIPVCSGCGGLGVVVNSDEFQKSISDIHKLRFAYCPIGNQKTLLSSEKLQRLNEYLDAVKRHYKMFNNYATKNSFAEEITNGFFDQLVEKLALEN